MKNILDMIGRALRSPGENALLDEYERHRRAAAKEATSAEAVAALKRELPEEYPDNALDTFAVPGSISYGAAEHNDERAARARSPRYEIFYLLARDTYEVVDNQRVRHTYCSTYEVAVAVCSNPDGNHWSWGYYAPGLTGGQRKPVPPPAVAAVGVAGPTGSWLGTEGRKDDDKKARLDLIPPEVVMALGEILTFGAKKYDPRNWEKGMRWGRCYAAALRHMVYWWAGKGPTTRSFLFGSLDEETGRSHLWHALCCIAFLVTYEERGVGEDDRLTGVAAKGR